MSRYWGPLVLLVLFVGISCAWWLDHRNLTDRLKAQEERLLVQMQPVNITVNQPPPVHVVYPAEFFLGSTSGTRPTWPVVDSSRPTPELNVKENLLEPAAELGFRPHKAQTTVGSDSNAANPADNLRQSRRAPRLHEPTQPPPLDFSFGSSAPSIRQEENSIRLFGPAVQIQRPTEMLWADQLHGLDDFTRRQAEVREAVQGFWPLRPKS